MNIISTLDPISLNDAATNPHLHLPDGDRDIYFASVENMHAYIDMHVASRASGAGPETQPR